MYGNPPAMQAEQECEVECDADLEGGGNCDFVGEVHVEVWSATAHWSCPKCGYVHEDERLGESIIEPDPDLAMDAARDAEIEDRL